MGSAKEIATISANTASILKDIDNLYQKYEKINNDKIDTIKITTEIKKIWNLSN